jgi:glycosyltransferase involved in cell wall biosynthesis
VSAKPEISVVIPAYNEAESIGALLEKVSDVMARLDRTFEIIVVDDGSVDATSEEVLRRIPGVRGLRLIALRANCGKSAALEAGFKSCAAVHAVVTLDADLQDDARRGLRSRQRVEAPPARPMDEATAEPHLQYDHILGHGNPTS